jgi:putative ABC transport system permease protein
VRTSFDQAGQSANGARRLQTGARLSFIQPLPASLESQIAAVPGVKRVTYANWFGGAYQDPHNQVFSFAVPPNYLDLFPEVAVTAAERKAFDETRIGALVGEQLAQRFKWKVGDKIPLQSTIFPDKSGSKNWPFEVVGILHASDKKTGGFFDQMLLLNWKYFDETTPYNRGAVGWYVSELADVSQGDRVAKAIDALSANSDHETRTQSEQAASASWMKQLADIGLIVGSIMGAVFFTLLLLSGNTMMQAVRERTGELAVLKTLGFSDGRILWMVLVESLLIAIVGGGIGLLLSYAGITAMGDPTHGMLPVFYFPIPSLITGTALVLTLGIASGMLPAFQASRLRIVDALRRN